MDSPSDDKLHLPKVQTAFCVTVADYLEAERKANERHIYLDGAVIAMAGESPEHGDVSANLMGILVPQLKGGPYRARTKDIKVRSGPILSAGETTQCLFSYPDIVIICGEPKYLEPHRDVVLNPKVVLEVLSESTEAFDRGEKHFSRQPDGSWTYRLTAGLKESVSIPSIKCTLRLADVYDRINFPQPDEAVE